MTPREKRFTLLSVLTALLVLSNVVSGWLEGYPSPLYREAPRPEPASAMLPAPVATGSPSRAAAPPDQAKPAPRAEVYAVYSGTYLMKPTWTCGGSGRMSLYFLDNSGRNVRYRDAGDRWIFDSNGLEQNSSIAPPMVRAVCLQEIELKPMRRNDREA